MDIPLMELTEQQFRVGTMWSILFLLWSVMCLTFNKKWK